MHVLGLIPNGGEPYRYLHRRLDGCSGRWTVTGHWTWWILTCGQGQHSGARWIGLWPCAWPCVDVGNPGVVGNGEPHEGKRRVGLQHL